MNFKVVIAGAVSGFVAALTIDINAWCNTTPKGKKNLPFDWRLAFKRWVAGGIMGGTAAMGWDVAVTI